MDQPSVPEGFVPLDSESPFIVATGARLFERRLPDRGRIVATRAIAQQANKDGFIHGGFLLALADFALSWGTFEPDDRPPAITLSLTSDFMRPARIGDWLEVHVTCRKASDSLLFADALILAGEKPIVRVSGVFRPVAPHRRAAGSERA